MSEYYWENKYRPTTICVDSCSDFVLKGRFYNLCLQNGKEFSSLMQLLLLMDELFDDMGFPKAYTSPRKFSRDSVCEYHPAASSEILKGAVATFEVRVIFRQHASWQGTVAWLEGKQEENGR